MTRSPVCSKCRMQACEPPGHLPARYIQHSHTINSGFGCTLWFLNVGKYLWHRRNRHVASIFAILRFVDQRYMGLSFPLKQRSVETLLFILAWQEEMAICTLFPIRLSQISAHDNYGRWTALGGQGGTLLCLALPGEVPVSIDALRHCTEAQRLFQKLSRPSPVKALFLLQTNIFS